VIGRYTLQARKKEHLELQKQTNKQRDSRLETNRVRTIQDRLSETEQQLDERRETDRIRTVRSRRSLNAEINFTTFHYYYIYI